MDIREEMELDKIKREERLQQFIKEERAKVLARRKAIAEPSPNSERARKESIFVNGFPGPMGGNWSLSPKK